MRFPAIYRIKQTFPRMIVQDIPAAVIDELQRMPSDKIRHGDRVAISAGSRGISQLPLILQTIVSYLRSIGAEPFIFPAMGSHGGATAEGQLRLLKKSGIDESSVGAPVISSMNAVEIGKTSDGVPVFIDENAYRSDHIVVVNRVKPHTKFKAPIESGLMKMMAIGMGKQKGADLYHKAAVQFGFAEIIVGAGREVLKKAPVFCGIGIVENAYHETAKIAALRPEDLEKEEMDLLALSKRLMPGLPFNEIDLLIVDEMGKNISGTGMDPNITGRNRDILGTFSHPVKVKRLFVRDLTDKSGGNATGLGLADITTQRLVDKINYESTYRNCITAISLEKAAVPMYFKSDRQAMEVALGSIGLTPPEEGRIVRIVNTLQLDELEVSETYYPQIIEQQNLEVLSGPYQWTFDAEGLLESAPF